MATTAIWPIRGRMDRVIAYVQNQEKTANLEWDASLQGALDYVTESGKTEHQYYVSGVNCDPATASEAMLLTKRQFGKMDGIVAYHGYQSFKPGEVTPDQAHAIGLALAERLWGDRFEVVLSTHLNTDALHNHFVINSVSFVDGKRYYDNKTTYAALRRASDDLCRARGLSVVAQENGRGQHYAEWRAEHAGEHTWRSAIREDVDRAVRASMTWSAFIRTLKGQGYAIKTGVKHMAIRPPGKERFVRLRSLGEQYTEEAIRQRILRQRMPERPPRPMERTLRGRAYGDFRLSKVTWKSLRALYFFYLRKLRAAREQPGTSGLYLIREDLRLLDRISRQNQFLCRHRIDTLEQLAALKENAEKRITLLVSERTALTNEKRRVGMTPEREDEISARLREITAQLKAHREEVRMCDGIVERVGEIRQKNKVLGGQEHSRECDVTKQRGVSLLARSFF